MKTQIFFFQSLEWFRVRQNTKNNGVLQGKFCIFTCPKDWHFSWKMNIRMSLTKHSQTPASLFLAWRFDLYPKVFLKGYERRSKVLLVSVSALSEFSPSVMPFKLEWVIKTSHFALLALYFLITSKLAFSLIASQRCPARTAKNVWVRAQNSAKNNFLPLWLETYLAWIFLFLRSFLNNYPWTSEKIRFSTSYEYKEWG